jgi:hypothetical protein
MTRWLAGIAAILLLVTGVFLALQGHAEGSSIPPAPNPRFATIPGPTTLAPIVAAPEADAKSNEEKRFARADKDENGRITLAELVEPRRKDFAKLDLNQDGKLSFEEWAVRTIDKVEDADADKSKSLTPAEYATTAPKPAKKKPACGCS